MTKELETWMLSRAEHSPEAHNKVFQAFGACLLCRAEEVMERERGLREAAKQWRDISVKMAREANDAWVAERGRVEVATATLRALEAALQTIGRILGDGSDWASVCNRGPDSFCAGEICPIHDVRKEARRALAGEPALPCATCGGAGYVLVEDEHEPCPVCEPKPANYCRDCPRSMDMNEEGYRCFHCNREFCRDHAERHFDMLGEPAPPTRWHKGMRESYWNTCWAYVNDNDVCIRLRGHDNNKHEPLMGEPAAQSPTLHGESSTATLDEGREAQHSG